MDNVRLFLFLALAFLGMLIYQAWQEDYGPKPVLRPSLILAATKRVKTTHPCHSRNSWER